MALKRLNKSNKKQTAKWAYLGETDPAQFIHSNKTHRTVSEAFRDAEYAQSFWKSKTDWEEAVEFIELAVLLVPVRHCVLVLRSVKVKTLLLLV